MSPWLQLVLLLALVPVALVVLLRLVLGQALFTHILGNLIYDLLKAAFFGAWRARTSLLWLLVIVIGLLIGVSQISSVQKSMQQSSQPAQQPMQTQQQSVQRPVQTYQQPAQPVIPQRSAVVQTPLQVELPYQLPAYKNASGTPEEECQHNIEVLMRFLIDFNSAALIKTSQFTFDQGMNVYRMLDNWMLSCAKYVPGGKYPFTVQPEPAQGLFLMTWKR